MNQLRTTIFARLPIWTRLSHAHKQLLLCAGWVSALSLLVKLTSMIKDLLIAQSFGAGQELDAFFMALAVPMFTFAVVSQSFSTAFIPALIEAREQRGLMVADDLIRSMFGRFMVMLAISVAVLVAGAQLFLPLVAWGFGPEQLALTSRIFRILVWIVPLSGISTYWGAVLNASEIFTIPAVAPMAIPLMALCGLFLFPQFGIDTLAWGTLAGYAIESVLLCSMIWFRGLPVLPTHKGHEQTGHITRQYGYLLAGSMLMSSSLLVDQSMATWLGPGSVSILNYGNKFVAVLIGTISLGLTTAVFPHFSRLAAKGDGQAIGQTLKRLVTTILLASIPLTILLMLFSRPIVRLLFERGAMNSETAAAIALVQICYLLQLPIYIVGVIGTRILMALGHGRLIFRIAGMNLVVNVLGNIVFSKLFGTCGIALSTSCVYLFSGILVYRSLRVELRRIHDQQQNNNVMVLERPWRMSA